MLVGKYPFYDERRSAVHKSILLGQFTYPSTVSVSDHAKDLIARLLERDPEKRITAQEALAHPWITVHCGGCSEVACGSSTPLRKCKTPPDQISAAAAAAFATPKHNARHVAGCEEPNSSWRE